MPEPTVHDWAGGGDGAADKSALADAINRYRETRARRVALEYQAGTISREDAEEALADFAKGYIDAWLDQQEPETGISTATLYGRYDGIGYPVAFDHPFGMGPLSEEAHDLVDAGTHWGIGYMLEMGGAWRPAVPFSMVLPKDEPPDDPEEDEEEEGEKDPPPPVGKLIPRTPQGFLPHPPVGRGRPRELSEDEILACDTQTYGEGWDQPADGGTPEPGTDSRQDLENRRLAPQYYYRTDTSLSERVVDGLGNVPVTPRSYSRDYPGLRIQYQPGQGSSAIKLPRPSGMSVHSDARVRLGGGPHHPEASQVPRGGVRMLDSYDFIAQQTTVYQAIEMVAMKVNQLVGLVNDRFPFGPSALDNAGLYVGVHPSMRKPALSAFPGTLAFTRRGERIQGWMQWNDDWRTWSPDAMPTRTWGDGDTQADVGFHVDTGKPKHRLAKRAPFFGWEKKARAMRVRNADLHVNGAVRVENLSGSGSSEITSEGTEERDFIIPDRDGEAALFSNSRTTLAVSDSQKISFGTTQDGSIVSGTQLQNDGSAGLKIETVDGSGTSTERLTLSSDGALSHKAGLEATFSHTLGQNGPSDSLTETLAETDLYSYTVDVGYLAVGGYIEITGHVECSGTNDTKDVKVKLIDAGASASTPIDVTIASGNAKFFSFTLRIGIEVAGASGDYSAWGPVVNAGTGDNVQVGNSGGFIDLSDDVTLKVTGTLAHASDSMQGRWCCAHVRRGVAG